MGLLDWFRKRKTASASPREPGVSLPQLCYDIAYFVLPRYAYNDLAKLTDLCIKSPTAAGPFFYVMSCQMRKVEPDMEAAKRFRWHHGGLDGGREYFALEYPVPPAVDLSGASVEQLMAGGDPPVLAPHFSAVVRDKRSGEAVYFVLGQAPIGGGTTLRCVSREGSNCNLGPGPEPRLSEFLSAISVR